MPAMRRAFTLIELLVVISIIALLITLLLPAIEGARQASHVTVCANQQHQILVALHSWGADNEGELPPGSGYANGTQPHHGVRGTGDFFDVLVLEYIEPPSVWYCPEGGLFPDTGNNSSVRNQTVNTLWDFAYHSPNSTGHASFTLAVYCNLTEKGGYKDIPRKLSDPGDWVLVNDRSSFSVPSDGYGSFNHPGSFPLWGLGQAVGGRNGLGAPRGINTGTVDGSVKWTPQQETMLGWPICGGGLGSFLLCRYLEPPRPGRPGVLP